MEQEINDGQEIGTGIMIATNAHVWAFKSAVQRGAWVHMINARTIRFWGTSKGINELVDGPTSETTLDALAPVMSVHAIAVIAIIPCAEGPWAKHLK